MTAPPLDPPAERVLSQGLAQRPSNSGSVVGKRPNSGVFDFPSRTVPDWANRCANSLVKGGTKSANALLPLVIRIPATISPYVIGGQRMAQAVLRPSVVDFIELATRSDYMALQIDETVIQKSSPLCGQELRNTGLRQDLGLIVVAIKRTDGKMIFNPPPETTIAERDTLITLGPRDRQDQLRSRAT